LSPDLAKRIARIAVIAITKLGACRRRDGVEVAKDLVKQSKQAALISPALAACVAARAEVGQLKYGTVLRRGWKRSAAGALQEAVDLLLYLFADPAASPRERKLAIELAELLVRRVLRLDEAGGGALQEEDAPIIPRVAPPAPEPAESLPAAEATDDTAEPLNAS
jgi:hypothetical protein